MPRSEGGAPAPPSDAERALLGAVQGADVYRAVRAAVRRHGDVLRLGNRFVAADGFREIALVAVGRGAVSAGFGALDALGDALTQGFLAGPDPLPEAIPFLHRRTSDDVVGTPEAEAIVGSVRELVEGLGGGDLLILVLTPGALGLLSTPPPGLGGDAYRALLDRLRLAGAASDDLERLVRATAGGLAGGRLLAASRGARILPLVVDRGGAVEAIGGGPTAPVTPLERDATRALLEHHLGAGSVPLELRRALDAPPPEGPPVRPVQIAGPSEAMQGGGDELSEHKWWSRLAELRLAGGPPAAAASFHARVEEVLKEVPSTRERRRGVAIFAGAPLECVDGAGEAAAVTRLLGELQRQARRREITYAVFRTAGHRPGDTAPVGAAFDARSPELVPLRPSAGTRPGVTDVGPVVVALRPEPER